MKSKILSLFLIILLVMLQSCSNDDSVDVTQEQDTPVNITTSVDGVIQKGPFQSGTNITMFELDEELIQTGQSFNTTSIGNRGQFSFPEITLESEFVELVADGFYFNEVTREPTQSRIVLKAVTSLNDSLDINVNLLTTLSLERIKYIVQSSDISFQEARIQAQNEIYSIFGYTNIDGQNFEQFDFTENGTASDQLLAISGMLLGINNPQELSEFITEFAFDIAEDGTLDSEALNIRLATSAETCAVGQIRVNLRDYYNDGSTFEGFQEYVESFRDFTPFEPKVSLDHPIQNSFGINLLPKRDMEMLDISESYCFIQNLMLENPDITNFYNLNIIVAQIRGSGSFNINPVDTSGDWHFDEYDFWINGQFYFAKVLSLPLQVVTNPELSATPATISFEGEGEIVVRYYFQIGEFPFEDATYAIDKYFTWE